MGVDDSRGGEVPNPTRSRGGYEDLPIETATRLQDPQSVSSFRDGVGWSKEELQVLQKEDANIGPVRLWLKAREFLDCDNSELKSYWAQFDYFVLVEGVVYRRFERPDGTDQYLQLLMPRCLRQRILEMLHAQATTFRVQKNVGTGAEEGFLGLLEDGRQPLLCVLQGL